MNEEQMIALSIVQLEGWNPSEEIRAAFARVHAGESTYEEEREKWRAELQKDCSLSGKGQMATKND